MKLIAHWPVCKPLCMFVCVYVCVNIHTHTIHFITQTCSILVLTKFWRFLCSLIVSLWNSCCLHLFMFLMFLLHGLWTINKLYNCSKPYIIKFILFHWKSNCGVWNTSLTGVFCWFSGSSIQRQGSSEYGVAVLCPDSVSKFDQEPASSTAPAAICTSPSGQ